MNFQSPAGTFFNEVSQFGEVSLLLRHFVGSGVVVDVGARGRERSNSYDLLKWFGWKGLLIEPNPALTEQILNDFAGLNVKLVTCAISDKPGIGTLHLGINEDISSLTAACAEAWGPVHGTIEVPVRRLPDVLDEHRIPAEFELLSIDAEGEDCKIFNDLITNSSYRPRWVIIEAAYDGRTKSLDDIPVAAAVRHMYRITDKTHANLILQRRAVC